MLLIGFREGLEAFLVVAIVTLALRRFGLLKLLGALRWGVIAAVTGSALLGLLLGPYAPRRQGHGSGDRAAARTGQRGPRRGRLVFGFTVFMVGREGVETATMIASLAGNHALRHMAAGGAMGLLIAAAIALLWVRYGHRVRLDRFFRVTAWFMALFALQLVIHALHEFTEAKLVPGIDNAWWHLATEDLAEGWIAQGISLALVVVPTGWLAGASLLDRRVPSPAALSRDEAPQRGCLRAETPSAKASGKGVGNRRDDPEISRK